MISLFWKAVFLETLKTKERNCFQKTKSLVLSYYFVFKCSNGANIRGLEFVHAKKIIRRENEAKITHSSR